MNEIICGHELKMRLATIDDNSFLTQVFVSTQNFLQLSGVLAEQVAAIIASQQVMQMNSYRSQYPKACHYIVEFKNQKVGQVIVDFEESNLHIVDLAFLPQAQGQGLATAVIKTLQQKGQSMTLVVEQSNNVARTLYLKLGFTVKAITPPHELFEWNISLTG